MKRISLIIGLTIGFCTLIGMVFGFNEYFAKAEDLKQVAMRLDQKIRQDRCDWMQQRIWQLEDRYQVMPPPDAVREEIRKLKADYERECQ
jgi:hypothetical protein